MILKNPTNAELNAAFAEKVAGWMRTTRCGQEVLYDPEGGHVLLTDTERHLPDFCSDANAVLVELNKHVAYITHQCSMWDVVIHCGYTGDKNQPFAKRLDYQGADKVFGRAAVIALLRAHGVEIESL